MTLIAFDFGLARIGVAIGNTITGNANPLTTLQSPQQQIDWATISALLDEWKPQHIIVGHPLRTDGSSSEMTLRAEKFSRQLQGRYQLPIHLVNETLSSNEAEQRLKQTRQAGRKKKIKKEEVDALAAAIILETWIKQNEFKGH